MKVKTIVWLSIVSLIAFFMLLTTSYGAIQLITNYSKPFTVINAKKPILNTAGSLVGEKNVDIEVYKILDNTTDVICYVTFSSLNDQHSVSCVR